jgi:ArsR family transcriptional regulator
VKIRRPKRPPQDVAGAYEKFGGERKLRDCLPPDAAVRAAAASMRSLGAPGGIRILYMLRTGPLCVYMMRPVLKYIPSRITYHLRRLRQAGYIRTERRGTYIVYSLTRRGDAAVRMIQELAACKEQDSTPPLDDPRPARC